MSVKEKIAKIRNKVAMLAVKTATVATLFGSAGVVTSCLENPPDTDETKDKTEKVEGKKDSKKVSVEKTEKKKTSVEKTENEKTSVVFRATHNSGNSTSVLFEDGTKIFSRDKKARFLEPGDTVTYDTKEDYNSLENNIKAVRYKDGNGKQVNFGKIGKVGKDITD